AGPIYIRNAWVAASPLAKTGRTAVAIVGTPQAIEVRARASADGNRVVIAAETVIRKSQTREGCPQQPDNPFETSKSRQSHDAHLAGGTQKCSAEWGWTGWQFQPAGQSRRELQRWVQRYPPFRLTPARTHTSHS